MATFNYNKANLAAAVIPASITAAQTSITIDAGDAALFPAVPFFATIMPAGGIPNTLNSEIVQVTAKNTSTGVLTITRAQRGTTAKAQDEGAAIMNGVYIEDLAQSQAVGLAFFYATNVSVSSSYSYWNIDNAMLPTAPTDGMSIRVVFGANTSGPAAQLRLNSGTYHNVYAGVGLTATASNVSTTTPFNPKSGVIYELVYYNGAWYAMNVPANNSITSDNVDWATLGNKIFPIGTVLTYYDTSDHSDFLGLTWARFAAGCMVVGYDSSDSDFSTIGNTGGEKTHKLIKEEMPKHKHNVTTALLHSDGQILNTEYINANLAAGQCRKRYYNIEDEMGGNQPHNNMPPYIVAALWRRTA